jgi:beta-glucanase (GH16 family)
MRASSTSPTPDGQGDRTSGETSACFIFSLNETELDVEQQGGKPDLIYFVTWKNGKNVSNFQSVARAWETFHEYRIEWLPGSVTYSIDGYIVGKETRDIPQQPGFIVINHWGSNRMAWGGLADEREKWMYVRSFSFMPLEN